jgi:hypothetical protein
MEIRMHWKLSSLIAALMLLTTLASPDTVVAQGLVEKTRTLAVVGIGTEQKLELYSYQRGGVYTITVTVFDDDTANGSCTETVQVTLEDAPGLNTVLLQMGAENKSILINEEEVELLACFKPLAERVVLDVAKEFPDNRAEGQSSTPGFDAEFALQYARHFSPVGHSIVNSDGTTSASSGGASLRPLYFLHKDLQGSNP